MGRREQRVLVRAQRLARHDTPATVVASLWWAGVADWARGAWRNATDRARGGWARATAPDPDCGLGGYPVCPTCRWGQHAGCGVLDTDPPCGCTCPHAEHYRWRQVAP